MSSRERPESPIDRTVWGSAITVANIGVKVAVQLVTLPIALAYLGTEEFGLWVLVQSIATYLTLSDAGLGQTVMNFAGAAYARHEREHVNEILATTFLLYLLIVVPVWAVCLIVDYVWPLAGWLIRDVPPHLTGPFSTAFFLAATLTLARVPLSLFSGLLLGLRELPLRQGLDLLASVVLLIATVCTLWLGGRMVALVLATNVSLLAVALLGYPVARSRHPFLSFRPGLVRRALLPALFRNATFFLLLGSAVLVDRAAGNLIIGKFGSLTLVPAMFVLLTIFRVLGWQLVDLVSRTMQPYIILLAVRARWRAVEFLAALATKIGFFVAVTFLVVTSIWAKDFLRLWLGRELFPGYLALFLLGGSFLIDALFLGVRNVIVALNKHRRLAIVAATKACLTAVLGILGAWWWVDRPLEGVTAGFLLANVLSQGVILPRVCAQELGLAWSDFLRHFLMRPMRLVAIVSLATPAMSVLPGWPPAPRAGATAVVLVYLLITTWFLVLRRDDRRWLSSVAAAVYKGSGAVTQGGMCLP